MEDIETYRSLFAEVLVLGSTIQGLKGQDQAKFERRTPAQAPPVEVESTVADGDVVEKVENGTGVGDTQQSWGQTVDGLKGLSRIMYRQHAKKLKRAYSVA